MRFMTVVIAVFLLFASSFILRDLLSEDEADSSTKAVKHEQKIDYAEAAVLQESEVSLASLENNSIEQTVKYDDEEIVQSYHTVKTKVDGPSQEEMEVRRMLVREQRVAIMADRKGYKKARDEWRTALNDAREEAVESGDYTRYKALKAEEPTKRKRLE